VITFNSFLFLYEGLFPVLIARQTVLIKPASTHRSGIISEKRKIELDKVAKKQHLNTKEEMTYLLERLDKHTPGGSLLSDLKLSLKQKENQIASLQQKVNSPKGAWHEGNTWLDRLLPVGFGIVAILCLLKSAGFIQAKKESPAL
jgi:hypothetical protein